MRTLVTPICSAALVAVLFAAQSLAAGSNAAPSTSLAQPAIGAKVHFEGCVRRGVENGCLVVQSNETTYDVTSGAAVLKVDRYQAGTGVVTDKASFCMQGIVLDQIVLDPKQSEKVCTQGTTP